MAPTADLGAVSSFHEVPERVIEKRSWSVDPLPLLPRGPTPERTPEDGLADRDVVVLGACSRRTERDTRLGAGSLDRAAVVGGVFGERQPVAGMRCTFAGAFAALGAKLARPVGVSPGCSAAQRQWSETTNGSGRVADDRPARASPHASVSAQSNEATPVERQRSFQRNNWVRLAKHFGRAALRGFVTPPTAARQHDPRPGRPAQSSFPDYKVIGRNSLWGPGERQHRTVYAALCHRP